MSGAEPTVTSNGAESPLLMSPQTRKSRHANCFFEVMQNRGATRLPVHPNGTIQIDPAELAP